MPGFIQAQSLVSLITLKALTAFVLQTSVLQRHLLDLVAQALQKVTALYLVLLSLSQELSKQAIRVELRRLFNSLRQFSAAFSFFIPWNSRPGRTALLLQAKREGLTICPARAAVRCSLVKGVPASLLSTLQLMGWFLFR